MKITIEKNDMMNLLSKTQNVVEKRNTMPVLVNVLLEAQDNHLKIYATDLEISITDQSPATVKEEGRIAVNAKNFFDIVKELEDDEIELTTKPNFWLEICQKKSLFNIVGLNHEEYPVFPTYHTEGFFELPTTTMKEMIEKTIYSVSQDETRYHLNGVFFQTLKDGDEIVLRMVATDGYRLSVIDRKADAISIQPDVSVIIPRKGLNEIRKLLDGSEKTVELGIEGSQLVVRAGTTLLMIRLIEGKYPNYQRLIPSQLPQQALVGRETFLHSLRRVSLLSNQKSKGVTLSLSEGKLEISSNNPEMGDAKEELPIEYEGPGLKVGFNAKYLLDILGSFQQSDVDLMLGDAISPGMIQPHEDKKYTCVVMPMRI